MALLEIKQELERAIAGAQASGHKPPEAVKRLCPEAIREHPELFQQRRPPEHASRQHIATLSTIPKSGKRLTPVLVFWAGDHWALLDGHHRMSAYRMAGWRREVPVSVFVGSLDEAIGRANRENHRAHMPMTTSEKMSAAWRMVCATKLTAEQISLDTGASMRSIASMRNVRRALIAKGQTLDALAGMTWHRADALAKERPAEESDWDEKDEKEAKALADKLLSVFGKRLHAKHQVIAMALEAYDNRLPDTLRELWDAERGRVESFEEDEESDF